MAITRAQQARQMLKKGSKKPVVQGGVDNYLGDQPQVVVPRKWQSGPNKPPTELAYITEAEKKLLLKEDIHGSLKDGPNEGPAGIMSLDSFGDIGGGQAGSEVDSGRSEDRAEKTTFSPVKSGSGSYKSRIKSPAEIKLDEQKLINLKKEEETKAKKFTEQAKKERNFFNQLKKVGLPTQRALYGIFPNNPKTELRYLADLKFRNPTAFAELPQELKDILAETEDPANEFMSYKDFDKLSFDDFKSLTNFQPTDGMNFADYAATYAGAPGLKYSGNVGNLEKYVIGKDEFGRTMYGYREKTGDGDGDGGMSDYERRLLELENQLKNQQAATTSAAETNPFYRIMADGGMTGDAPMMQGGITDLALRDEFFLGGIVKGIKKGLKGVTRAVKKVAKSPIGKAALLAGVAGIPFGGGSFFGQGSLFGKASGLLKSQGLKDFFLKNADKGFSLGNLSTAGIVTPLLAAPFIGELLGLNKQDEPVVDRGPGLDFNAQQFYRLAADGGLMRQQYQEGSKEPVAKKTMPLIDMGGKEKDYRETGGFVDMGRMERADDVPARLSKNEFVFTAEAVRNAGDGDVDKGSEVMYNMMKNLESGGDVSEESQGLDGARKMFQTSQRLEEVL